MYDSKMFDSGAPFQPGKLYKFIQGSRRGLLSYLLLLADLHRLITNILSRYNSTWEYNSISRYEYLTGNIVPF